jgi:hyaluronan synthase
MYRHLTNCVLQKGHKVVYTHLAFCETETPEKFLRWFKQQTRWSKSFYRELLWNAKSIHKHSPWMAAELFYQGLYPFILLFSIFFTLWSRIPLALATWLISLVAIGCIKTLYALVVSRNYRFLLFPVYSLYYLLGLVPAKLWALVSMWDVGWGTSARSASELKKESQILLKLKEALPVIFWWLLILGGVIFNVVIFIVHPPLMPYDVSKPSTIVFYPNPDQIGAESFST